MGNWGERDVKFSTKTYGSGLAIWALTVAVVSLNSCGPTEADKANEQLTAAVEDILPPGLEPGSNEMLRAPITAAPELEVLISDVIIPAGAEVPRHFHPGEEFVYVIDGSAIHVEDGKPDKETKAGDAMVISPEAVHAPRGGPDGARAIVFRVHLEGQPERILVSEEGEPIAN